MAGRAPPGRRDPDDAAGRAIARSRRVPPPQMVVVAACGRRGGRGVGEEVGDESPAKASVHHGASPVVNSRAGVRAGVTAAQKA